MAFSIKTNIEKLRNLKVSDWDFFRTLLAESLDKLQTGIVAAQKSLSDAQATLTTVTEITKPIASGPTQVDASTIVVSVNDITTDVTGKQSVQIKITYRAIPNAPTTWINVWTTDFPFTLPVTVFTPRGAATPNGQDIYFWMDAPEVPTEYWFMLGASTPTYQAQPSTSLPGAHFLISANSLAGQIGGFVVYGPDPTQGGQTLKRAGLPLGRFVFQFTKPTDGYYDHTLIDRVKCDDPAAHGGVYVPAAGEDFKTYLTLVNSLDEEELYWPLPTAEEWWIFRGASVNRQGQVNTTLRPVYNIHVPGNGGLDTSGFDPSTLSNEFVISGGKLTQNVVDLAKALNFDINDFQISGGAFLVRAIGVNKLIAGTALFTGDVILARQGGGKVTLNSGSITMENGTQKVTVTPTLVRIEQAPGSFIEIDSNGLSITGGSSIALWTDQTVQARTLTLAPGGRGATALLIIDSGTPSVTCSNKPLVLAGIGAAAAGTPGAHTMTIPKITGGGSNGSLTWNADGVITGYTDPT